MNAALGFVGVLVGAIVSFAGVRYSAASIQRHADAEALASSIADVTATSLRILVVTQGWRLRRASGVTPPENTSWLVDHVTEALVDLGRAYGRLVIVSPREVVSLAKAVSDACGDILNEASRGLDSKKAEQLEEALNLKRIQFLEVSRRNHLKSVGRAAGSELTPGL